MFPNCLFNKNSLLRINVSGCFYLASPVGIEPTTNGLKSPLLYQLSYGLTIAKAALENRLHCVGVNLIIRLHPMRYFSGRSDLTQFPTPDTQEPGQNHLRAPLPRPLNRFPG